MYHWINQFHQYLEVEKNASPHTVKNYISDLLHFTHFLETTGFGFSAEDQPANPAELTEITRMDVRGYVATLRQNGMASTSIARKTSALNRFFSYLSKQGLLERSPMLDIHVPKKAKRLPEHLTIDDLERLLLPSEAEGLLGLRDDAVMQLFYSTGVRCEELSRMNEEDLDLSAGTVRVHGKRAKERIVLIGQRAAAKLRTYLAAKPEYLTEDRCRRGVAGYLPGRTPLFVNSYGRRAMPRTLYKVVSLAVKRAGLQRHVSPHTLRHTFATHLMNSGADLRSISEMLGHANLSSTQVYTHVDMKRLMEVYSQAHPRAQEMAGPKESIPATE